MKGHSRVSPAEKAAAAAEGARRTSERKVKGCGWRWGRGALLYMGCTYVRESTRGSPENFPYSP